MNIQDKPTSILWEIKKILDKREGWELDLSLKHELNEYEQLVIERLEEVLKHKN